MPLPTTTTTTTTTTTSEAVSGIHVALRVLPQGGEKDIHPGKTRYHAPGSEGLLLPQKHGYFLSSRTTGLGLVASGVDHPSAARRTGDVEKTQGLPAMYAVRY